MNGKKYRCVKYRFFFILLRFSVLSNFPRALRFSKKSGKTVEQMWKSMGFVIFDFILALCVVNNCRRNTTCLHNNNIRPF